METIMVNLRSDGTDIKALKRHVNENLSDTHKEYMRVFTRYMVNGDDTVDPDILLERQDFILDEDLVELSDGNLDALQEYFGINISSIKKDAMMYLYTDTDDVSYEDMVEYRDQLAPNDTWEVIVPV